MFASTLTTLQEGLSQVLSDVGNMRSLSVLAGAIFLAYFLSKWAGRIVVRIAQFIAVRADRSSDEEKLIKLRRIETYFSVGIAILRAAIVCTIAFYAIRFLSPKSSAAFATIGAGTFFVVFAGAMIGPLLRDISAGSIMIAEQWFSVGDFIRVEPFAQVAGVVEHVTLRSTKIRNIYGEVIWLHNQYIQAVKTTPRGIRTLAIDVFVRDLDAALKIIEDVSHTLPTGPTMLATPISVHEKEQLGPKLWRITMIGQTAPGREWLIEDFIKNALKDADEEHPKKKIIVYGPLVRNADEIAEKRFKRAVRAKME